jgi:hypothetical protein
MAGLKKTEKQKLIKQGRCTRCKAKAKPLKFIHDNADHTDLVIEPAKPDSRNGLCPECLTKREKEMRVGLRQRESGKLPWQKAKPAKPKPKAKPKAKRQPRTKTKAAA